MNSKIFIRLFFLFFFIQIAVDLAQSLTLFPFVHYGMFSGSFHRADSTEIFEVTADGRILRAKDFRIYVWDQVHAPLIARERQMKTEDFAFDREKMSAGMQKTGLEKLYRLMEPNLTNDPALGDKFPEWYRRYLGSLIGHPVQRLRVDRIWYHYETGSYQLLKKEKWMEL